MKPLTSGCPGSSTIWVRFLLQAALHAARHLLSLFSCFCLSKPGAAAVTHAVKRHWDWVHGLKYDAVSCSQPACLRERVSDRDSEWEEGESRWTSRMKSYSLIASHTHCSTTLSVCLSVHKRLVQPSSFRQSVQSPSVLRVWTSF